jgi:hypothetical protein
MLQAQAARRAENRQEAIDDVCAVQDRACERWKVAFAAPSKTRKTAPSHDQIVRHMVLRDLCVISGVLLRGRKPSRFCILGRCRPVMSGNEPVMRGRSQTVAHICHSV